MKLKKIYFPIFFVLFAFCNSFSQEQKQFNVNVTYDFDSGVPVSLTVHGKSETKGYLGISIYPAVVTDLLTEGKHFQIELKDKKFSEEIKLGEYFYNGSFEIAIWGKKVLKSECQLQDCYWCKTNGFHLDELLGYSSGFLFWK